MNPAEAVFTGIYNALEQVNDATTFATAHAVIKKAALTVNEFNRPGCYSVIYVQKMANAAYENFAKAMAIKARDATGIVPSIDSCKVVEQLPMGFSREIRIGDRTAYQRVWELKADDNFLIIFRTDGIKFIATNELEKGQHETIFTARYLVDAHPNPKYNTAESFLERVMNPSYGNLGKLSSANNLGERYKSIVKGKN